MIHKPNFFVFTGGPGVGKTTVLRHLGAAGEQVVEENARAVIREQMASGGSALPWRDAAAFFRMMAGRDIAAFDARVAETARVFFDRGIFDSYGADGTLPEPALIEAVRTRRYNRRVFVFPPWREIYETDVERKQDWPDAERTFDTVMRVLPILGYEAVVVPQAGVPERARFILDVASEDQPQSGR